MEDPTGKIVWDSGRTSSDECFDIPYSGEALLPLTRYSWNVTTVDSNGQEKTATDKAWFETGLLDSGWDGAKWITPSAKTDANSPDIKKYKIDADIEISNLSAGRTLHHHS